MIFCLLLKSGLGAAPDRLGPMHLLAEAQGGRLLGAVPCYAKSHSQGEYVFDHGWADAYERAGGNYYPKLRCRCRSRRGRAPSAGAAGTAGRRGARVLPTAWRRFCRSRRPPPFM